MARFLFWWQPISLVEELMWRVLRMFSITIYLTSRKVMFTVLGELPEQVAVELPMLFVTIVKVDTSSEYNNLSDRKYQLIANMSSTLLERFPSRAKNQARSRILRELKSVRGITTPIIHVVKIKIALEEIQITIKGIEAAIAATTIATITTIRIVTITTATITVTIQTTDAVLIVQIVIAMKIDFEQQKDFPF